MGGHVGFGDLGLSILFIKFSIKLDSAEPMM
jgi:hypothetical protein